MDTGSLRVPTVTIQSDYAWEDYYISTLDSKFNDTINGYKHTNPVHNPNGSVSYTINSYIIDNKSIRYYYYSSRYSAWAEIGAGFIEYMIPSQFVGITNAATFSNEQMKVMTANKLLALPLSNWDKFNSDQLNAIPVLEFGGLSSTSSSVSRLALLSADALSGLDVAHTVTFAPNDVLAIARSDMDVNGRSVKLGSLSHIEGALNVAVSGVMTAGMVASLHNDVWASMANNFTSGNSVAVSRAAGFLNGLSQEAFQAIPVSTLRVLDVSRTVNGVETYLLQGLDIAHVSYLTQRNIMR